MTLNFNRRAGWLRSTRSLVAAAACLIVALAAGMAAATSTAQAAAGMSLAASKAASKASDGLGMIETVSYESKRHLKNYRTKRSGKRYGTKSKSRKYGKKRYSSKKRYKAKTARAYKTTRKSKKSRKSAQKRKSNRVRVAALGKGSYDVSPGKKKSLSGGGGVRWVASSGCLAPSLRSKVYAVAANYGRVTVSSTCRSKARNRKAGGAKRSQHLTGNAVDFRVHGNWRAAAAYLRSHNGGFKHYGGGLFHIDGGPRRRW